MKLSLTSQSRTFIHCSLYYHKNASNLSLERWLWYTAGDRRLDSYADPLLEIISLTCYAYTNMITNTLPLQAYNSTEAGMALSLIGAGW